MRENSKVAVQLFFKKKTLAIHKDVQHKSRPRPEAGIGLVHPDNAEKNPFSNYLPALDKHGKKRRQKIIQSFIKAQNLKN